MNFITWLTVLIAVAAVIYIIVRRPFSGTVKDAVDDSDPLPVNRSGKTKEHSIDGE